MRSFHNLCTARGVERVLQVGAGVRWLNFLNEGEAFFFWACRNESLVENDECFVACMLFFLKSQKKVGTIFRFCMWMPFLKGIVLVAQSK